jgi:hypothetical protein
LPAALRWGVSLASCQAQPHRPMFNEARQTWPTTPKVAPEGSAFRTDPDP